MGNCKSEPLNLQSSGTNVFVQCSSHPLPKAEEIFFSIVKIQAIMRGYLARRKYLQHLETSRDVVNTRNLHNYARQKLLLRNMTYEAFDYSISAPHNEKPAKSKLKSIESSDGKIKYYGEW